MKKLILICISLTLLWIYSCSGEHAGKTTTTTNGIALLDPLGNPVAHAQVWVASKYEQGYPADLDTLWSDSLGIVELDTPPQFICVLSADSLWGAIQKKGLLSDTLYLDSVREIRLQGEPNAKLSLDSTFIEVPLDSNGQGILHALPYGDYALLDLYQQIRGVFHVNQQTIWNSYVLDSIGASTSHGKTFLWIDDFEDRNSKPIPNESIQWKFFSLNTEWKCNPNTQFETCLATTSTSSHLSLTYQMDSANSWIAAQLAPVTWNLSRADSLCFDYRSDAGLKVEFLRQYIDDPDWGAVLDIPASKSWKTTCLDLQKVRYYSAVPDSLQNWSLYADWVVQMQWVGKGNGSYLELDNIRFSIEN